MPDIKSFIQRIWRKRPVRLAVYLTLASALGYNLTPEQANFLDAIFQETGQ